MHEPQIGLKDGTPMPSQSPLTPHTPNFHWPLAYFDPGRQSRTTTYVVLLGIRREGGLQGSSLSGIAIFLFSRGLLRMRDVFWKMGFRDVRWDCVRWYGGFARATAYLGGQG